MTAKRSSHVNCLHGSAAKIFGYDSDFFAWKFDRSSIKEFQALLGVKDTPKGKRYLMLPPILYPDGSNMNPKQLFLNPALVKVGTFLN